MCMECTKLCMRLCWVDNRLGVEDINAIGGCLFIRMEEW